MCDERFTYIGNRQVWGKDNEPFGIFEHDRAFHMHIIGKTGTGKSTLLRNMMIQDIHNGYGVALIDPHGDLADELLDHIPPHRFDDVVYFNPADVEYPIGLNLLEDVPIDERHLVASGIVCSFKSIWRDSWGVRMEYILYATVASLLDCQNTSILGIQRMLTDSQYRAWVVKQVKDPRIRSFWVDEFAKYDERFMREAVAPIQNKVGQLLVAAPIRNTFGQIRSGFNPRFMMDDSRILIASLAKGKLGEDKANLLGALLVTQFQLAAMARANMPESERRMFYLYIDEFSNFTTDSFASILSEARKYRLSLVLSHQYSGQVSDQIHDAIYGNVGTHVAFRVSSKDAELLAQDFGEEFRSSHFTDLSNHEAYIKKLSDGEQIQPFKGKTFPPLEVPHNKKEKLIQLSRKKYGVSRKTVEDRVCRWSTILPT